MWMHGKNDGAYMAEEDITLVTYRQSMMVSEHQNGKYTLLANIRPISHHHHQCVCEVVSPIMR